MRYQQVEADFSKMTSEDFERCLDELLDDSNMYDEILQLPGVMGIVREEMNNDVMNFWADQNPDLAYPKDEDDDEDEEQEDNI